MKILLVCLGNICRSPLADALLRKKVKERGLGIQIDSAGTANYHVGKSPDQRTQNNALKHGVDMSELRARQFSAKDFQDFDLIYVMDKSNLQNVLALASTKEEREKVNLILEVVENNIVSEVPDPYYGGEEGFELVYNLLDEATNTILDKI